MKIETKKIGASIVLRLSGRIEDEGVQSLTEKLDRLLEQGHSKLIFDLSEVPYTTSTGLAPIVKACGGAERDHGFVRVVNPQPIVEELFYLSKLDTVIDIFPTVEEALASEDAGAE